MHLSEWLTPTTEETTGVDEDVKKGGPSCTAGGNVNWGSHCGNSKFPQRVKK